MFMMNYEDKDTHIEELIIRSFTGELTTGDRDELNKWLNASEENKYTYNDYLQIWKGSDRLKLKSEINIPEALTETRKAAGIAKGSRKIFLTLARIAAIFILAVCISVVYNKFIVSTPKTETAVTTYQQVKAAFGTQSRIELPDGTIVFLNSGSSMRFPSSFNTNETRKVELTGEGHFSVTNNEKQPFIVVTDKFQVRVLGTTFSINAYPGNSLHTVALVEGRVNLIQQGKAEEKTIEMQKNQVCSFNPTDNKFTLQNEENLNKYIQWINGKIVFYNDHINTVVEKLENWYNVDIEIADSKLETYRFTGTFVDEPIEQILDVLNLTSNMQYKIYSAKKMTDNTYSKRKIVLKSK
jgi:ferric-dicitrate binding protein FerR (iron transport regulator)